MNVGGPFVIGRALARALAAGLLLLGLGCASVGGTGPGTGSSLRNLPASAPMDQVRLEQVFANQVEAIEGPLGAIQSRVDGIPVYCVSDAEKDRMRILSPIRPVEGLDARGLEILLKANFHTALDARYAVSADGYVFAVFLHPISSLRPELIESALSQVVNLVKTFGTTFSSGDLTFPTPDAEAGLPAADPAKSP